MVQGKVSSSVKETKGKFNTEKRRSVKAERLFGKMENIMAKWMVAAKKADFNKISEKFGITPVIARILRNRDFIQEEEIYRFLHGDNSDLHHPFLLKDMEAAVQCILNKIDQKVFIRIIGDYDVDGICSAYILLRGIGALTNQVDAVIPHRMKDGYGLNEALVEEAAKDGIDTIITCDNGISAAAQIAYANTLNMTVIVTDHHEVPFEEVDSKKHYMLPAAAAVVDPKRPDCAYPYKQICGAVVAYKLVQALFEQVKSVGGDALGSVEILEELMVFAALATICDVMELRDENRIIVKNGLKAMKTTKNQGLRALLEVCGLAGKELSPYHAGFILGPCLNATGRLDTAGRALSLFEEQDYRKAVIAAGDLKNLNDSRKRMTEEGMLQAIRQVEEEELYRDMVLIVYLPDCHESLAGIIAGRVKERYRKPVFVLTRGDEGIKGSGRSMEAYSMYEEMTRCKELFTKYGGHKMAAGLSMADEGDVEKLRLMLNRNCMLTEEDFEETVHIDVPMPLSYINKEFVEEISLLEPFGHGNPKPLFARKNISLISGKIFGKNKNVAKYRICEDEGGEFEMIYFGDLQLFDTFLTERFGSGLVQKLYTGGLVKKNAMISIAYHTEINFFAGRETVQLVMQHYC